MILLNKITYEIQQTMSVKFRLLEKGINPKVAKKVTGKTTQKIKSGLKNGQKNGLKGSQEIAG